METNTRTPAEIVKAAQIEMKTYPIPARLDREPEEWDKTASHWVLSIYRVGFGTPEPMTVQYSMGSAHKGQPKLLDVMENLISDYSNNYSTFENFCAELDYDTDSRKAEETYRAVVAQNAKLLRLLGPEIISQLQEAFNL